MKILQYLLLFITVILAGIVGGRDYFKKHQFNSRDQAEAYE